jgi:hypothetical protein
MQLIISAGVIQPGGDDPQKNLAMLAATARAAQSARTTARSEAAPSSAE